MRQSCSYMEIGTTMRMMQHKSSAVDVAYGERRRPTSTICKDVLVRM